MSDYEEKTIRLMAQEGGRMLSEVERLQAENAKLHAELTDLSLNSCPSCGIKVENEELRKLVRCLVKAEHPSDRAMLIANAAGMLAEHKKDVDYLCDMCANDCDERKVIHVGQGAYDVCEKWKGVEA